LDNLTILFGGPNSRVTSLALVSPVVTCFSEFSSKGLKSLPRPKTAQPAQIDAASNMMITKHLLFTESWPLSLKLRMIILGVNLAAFRSFLTSVHRSSLLNLPSGFCDVECRYVRIENLPLLLFASAKVNFSLLSFGDCFSDRLILYDAAHIVNDSSVCPFLPFQSAVGRSHNAKI